MGLQQVVVLRLVQVYLIARLGFWATSLALADVGREEARIASVFFALTANVVAAVAVGYITRANRTLVPPRTQGYFLRLSPLRWRWWTCRGRFRPEAGKRGWA